MQRNTYKGFHANLLETSIVKVLEHTDCDVISGQKEKEEKGKHGFLLKILILVIGYLPILYNPCFLSACSTGTQHEVRDVCLPLLVVMNSISPQYTSNSNVHFTATHGYKQQEIENNNKKFRVYITFDDVFWYIFVIEKCYQVLFRLSITFAATNSGKRTWQVPIMHNHSRKMTNHSSGFQLKISHFFPKRKRFVRNFTFRMKFNNFPWNHFVIREKITEIFRFSDSLCTTLLNCLYIPRGRTGVVTFDSAFLFKFYFILLILKTLKNFIDVRLKATCWFFKPWVSTRYYHLFLFPDNRLSPTSFPFRCHGNQWSFFPNKWSSHIYLTSQMQFFKDTMSILVPLNVCQHWTWYSNGFWDKTKLQ